MAEGTPIENTSPSPGQFHIGDAVGDYRVIGIIGNGAAGEVYKVEHTITRRVEAMKVLLHTRPDSNDQAHRFLREIQLQASLSHPNIASVLNAMRTGDDLVMVMELVEGRTLDKVMEAGRLSLETGVGYVLQALSALAYAHSHGVAHRDIKPANMLITPAGVLKLTDFGLARTLGDPRLTQTGAVVGSLHYISPEQVQSMADVDFRTDIYSLGAVLYEVVTGTRPFPTDNAFALMLAHVQELPQVPHLRDASVPEALSRVIVRALAKRREDRYQSAEDFRSALEAAATETVQAVPVHPPRRRQRLLWLAAAAALLGFTGMIGVRMWLDKLSDPPPALTLTKPHPPPVPATGEREGPPREVTSVVVRAPANVEIESRPAAPKTQPAEKGHAPTRETQPPPVHTAVAEPKPAPATPVLPDRGPPPLPQGPLRPVGLLPPGHGSSSLALSPDGSWLAVGSQEGAVDIWQLRPPRRHATFSAHTSPVASLAFTPDASRLVSGGVDGAIKVWSLRDRMESKTFGQSAPVLSVAVSPDGHWVAFGTSDRKVRLWSLVEKGVVIDLRDVRREARALAFHPSGAWLAMASQEKTVRVWRTAGARAQLRFDGIERGASSVSYSQDGQYLGVASGDQIRILDATDGRSLHLANAPPRVMAFSFLAGGHCVALLRTTEGGKVWDVWQGQELRAGRGDRGFLLAAFRGDGREVALVGDNSVIAIWPDVPLPPRQKLLTNSSR